MSILKIHKIKVHHLNLFSWNIEVKKISIRKKRRAVKKFCVTGSEEIIRF